MAIVGDSRGEVAAARERTAHEVERGALVLAVRHGVVDHLVKQFDGAVEPEQRVVRNAMPALLGEADFAGHPFAEIDEKSIIVGLQSRGPGGHLIGEIRIVIEQLRARVDNGLGAQGGDVVGIALKGGAQVFHCQRESQRAALGLLLLVELDEVRPGNLVKHFAVARPLFAPLLQFLRASEVLPSRKSIMACRSALVFSGRGTAGNPRS